MVRIINVIIITASLNNLLLHQVPARKSEGPRRGKQGLSLSLPASCVVQQIGSASQIQILNSECQARGDQSDGVTASLSFRAGQGLGIQEVHSPRFSPRRSQRSFTWGQINHFLWGELSDFVTIFLQLSLSFLFSSSVMGGFIGDVTSSIKSARWVLMTRQFGPTN